MKKDELIGKVAEGKLPRRDFMKLLSAAGLALTTLPSTARQALAAPTDNAVSFTWSGYDVPQFFPAYVAKHGKPPEMALISTPEDALSKIRGGFKVDIAHPYSSNVARWSEADVLQPIDTSRLSHWNDVFDVLKTLPDSVDKDGKQLFLPVDWGRVSIGYRTDMVKLDKPSWSLLWDKTYEGRVSMIGDPAMAAPIAGLYLSLKDPFNPDDADFDKIVEALRSQRDLSRFFWDSGATIEQALMSGEVVAAPIWNGSYAVVQGQGAPVAMMDPAEGSLCFVAGLTFIKGAEHTESAYELMDAILSPETGKYLIETYGFGHSNRKAFDLVAPEVLAKNALPKDVEEFFAKGVLLKAFSRNEQFAKVFQEIKSGF